MRCVADEVETMDLMSLKLMLMLMNLDLLKSMLSSRSNVNDDP